jgi:hypothetical protein
VALLKERTLQEFGVPFLSFLVGVQVQVRACPSPPIALPNDTLAIDTEDVGVRKTVVRPSFDAPTSQFRITLTSPLRQPGRAFNLKK